MRYEERNLFESIEYQLEDKTLDAQELLAEVKEIKLEFAEKQDVTLLNASEATNFIYKLEGMDAAAMEAANAIDTSTKLQDRMQYLKQKCTAIRFVGMNSAMFEYNLQQLDTGLPEMLGQVLLTRFLDGRRDSEYLMFRLQEINPLKLKNVVLYAHKYRQFLCQVALGMTATKEWHEVELADMQQLADKGKRNILACYLYKRKLLGDYLLDNTMLETASTKRHKYGVVYEKAGEYYINLNLQIRFKYANGRQEQE